MNFIKKLAVLGAGIMLLMAPASYAADECISYDKDTYRITVTPEADENNAYADIALFMHIESSDKIGEMTYEEFAQLTPYFYEKKADEDGYVEFDFAFTGNSGNYEIYVSSSIADRRGNGIFHTETLWFDSKEDLEMTLSGLNTAIAEGTVDTYIQDADVRRMLGIEEFYADASDKSIISEALSSLGNVESYAQIEAGLAEMIADKIALEKEIKELDKSTVWTQIKPLVDKYFEVTGTECDEYEYYSDLKNTSGVDKKMLKYIPFSGLNDFFTDFKKSVEDYQDAGSGGGGSGGSGSGGIVIGGGDNGSSITVSGNLSGTVPTVPEVGNKTGFNDVPDSYWAKSYITALVEKGIVKGVGDNNFAPENSVTREQYITMLMLAANVDCGNEASNFTDVKQGDWYYQYVAKAQSIGLASGYTDGSFGIGADITREDLCVLGYRLIKQYKDVETEESAELKFTDKEAISDYAIEAVEFMQNNGIVHGYEDGSFKPSGTATRAEACIIIYLISQYLN